MNVQAVTIARVSATVTRGGDTTIAFFVQTKIDTSQFPNLHTKNNLKFSVNLVDYWFTHRCEIIEYYLAWITKSAQCIQRVH